MDQHKRKLYYAFAHIFISDKQKLKFQAFVFANARNAREFSSEILFGYAICLKQTLVRSLWESLFFSSFIHQKPNTSWE